MKINFALLLIIINAITIFDSKINYSANYELNYLSCPNLLIYNEVDRTIKLSEFLSQNYKYGVPYENN